MTYLVLDIRITASGNSTRFVVPVMPETLSISRGGFGLGNEIQIVDADGQQRVWFAVRIVGLRFVDMEDDESTQSAETVREVSAELQPT